MNIKKDDKGWEKPKIESLGKAKNIIQSINTVGSGDAQFSVLNS